MKYVIMALFVLSTTVIVILVSALEVSMQKSLVESDPYQLSTHVLDIGKGGAAKDIEVHLHSLSNGTDWTLTDKNITDSNGRIKNFLSRKVNPDNTGIYKLVFFTEPYFKASNQSTFYPQIEVIFQISDSTHYHVPITLTNYGYSTYRGT